MTSFVMPTYFNRLPVAFERGSGAWLWDTEGKQYLDSLSGIAVCGLGHAHPAITAAITRQAAKLMHTSNNYHIPNQEKLAEELCSVSGMQQAYFCNSGAETNESAIKLVRLFAKKKNITEPIIITMKNSFHGRSFATLSASGTERIQIGFEPLMPGFIYADFNDITLIKQLAKTHKNIVAVMFEPIQGDGGVRIADIEYLQEVRALCDQQDWLFILDEVQTGIGRTGKWFAYQHTNVLPDILTVAKTLGNGFPIGACLARGKACDLFGPGKHGTTFGGNPLGCAIGSEVLKVIKEKNILQHVVELGNYLLTSLKNKLRHHQRIVDIRGKGLMIGIELDCRCVDIVALALKYKLLINVTANNVIRLLPPLILSKEEADELVNRLDASLKEFFAL